MRAALLFVALCSCAVRAPGLQESNETAEAAISDIQLGRFPEAAGQLRAALKQYPKNVSLWNLLGIAEGEAHHDDGARSAFERGLQLAPDSVSLHENLGLLFFKQANYASARENLARAVALGSRRPGVLFSLASSKLRTGDPSGALTDLRPLETAFSGISGYWDERGRAEMETDPAAAEKSFARALELQPDDTTASNGAASAAERQGLDEKALAYLIQARQRHPDDVMTLAHFGSVCIRRDLGLDALHALERAHNLEPSNGSVLYLLARANVSVGNWQQAYDLFAQFSKNAPGYAPAYFAMGWLDIKLNRIEDARRQLTHCLSIDPKLTDARYTFAQLELDDGNLGSAQAQLEAVLKEDPHNAKANAALGDLMMRRGNLDAAQKLLQTAAREDPTLASAHYKLAMLFFRRHETQQAEAERALAAKLNAAADRVSKTQHELILPDTEASIRP